MEHSEKVSLLVDLQAAADDQFISESLSRLKHGEYIVGLWRKTIDNEIGKMFGSSTEEVSNDMDKLRYKLDEISKTPIMQLLTQFYAKYSQSTPPSQPMQQVQQGMVQTSEQLKNPPSRSSGIYPY